MEKAYDLSVLVAKLKAKGLDVAEDAVRVIVEETLNFITESAVASENKMDDLLLAIIPVVKPHILKAVDKIDGKLN